MALHYTITRSASTTAPKALSHKVTRRKDSFARALYAEAYAMLEANGLLDRPCAWRVMEEVEALSQAYAKELPQGHYRQDTIWLGTSDAYGKLDHIVVSQARR